MKIKEKDSKLIARLKMLYLIPVWLVSFPLVCFIVGFKEYGIESFKVMIKIIKTGSP